MVTHKMWPWNSKETEIEKRLMKLEAQIGVIQADYKDAYDKVTATAMRIENRYRVADARGQQEQEQAELRALLGGVDIAAIMKDPDALKEALANPAIIQYGLKKILGKELI